MVHTIVTVTSLLELKLAELTYCRYLLKKLFGGSIFYIWIWYEPSKSRPPKRAPYTPLLCVQMDFTRTFHTNTKCNNINHVWSRFYKILVILKYHRRLWGNVFDTDISRCINTFIKVVCLAFFGIFLLLKMSSVKDIGS